MTVSYAISKHAVALISIMGSSFDVLGALYLAYDLLGGEHGPLRTLSRAVTYGTLFGIGYGLALGPVFGAVCGLAHGITLAWEFSRVSRNQPKAGFWLDSFMSSIRGCGFALGTAYLFGLRFGIAFGLLSTFGQIIAYRFGIRPTANYQPAPRPRMTRLHLWSAANRTVGYAFAGYISSLLAHERDEAVGVGIKTGLAIGIVTILAGACTPLVEWAADRVPERRMGVFGVCLILIGFSLQSVQYWLALLDVPVQPH